MKAKRWTLGVVLAAAVSLWGLVEADASPFSSYILADDLGNTINGSVAEAGGWDDGSGAADSGSGNSGSGNSGNGDSAGSSGNDDSAGSENADGTGESSSGGVENDGHGNNADGVDSSNKGNSKTGEDTVCADGTVCDDEVKGGRSTTNGG